MIKETFDNDPIQKAKVKNLKQNVDVILNPPPVPEPKVSKLPA